MGKITVVLSDQVEDSIRAVTRRKGDLSRIVEQALEDWLKKYQPIDQTIPKEGKIVE